MAHPVKFDGCNKNFGPPPGQEHRVGSLDVMLTKQGQNVSCWKLDEEELRQIAEDGCVYLSIQSGSVMFPVYVSSRQSLNQVIGDSGSIAGKPL